jgi:hypothetical protein
MVDRSLALIRLCPYLRGGAPHSRFCRVLDLLDMANAALGEWDSGTEDGRMMTELIERRRLAYKNYVCWVASSN